MDKRKLDKKIIGYEYVSWHSQVFAVDVYEGNYFYYPDGNVDDIKDPKRYERIFSQYQEKVEKGEKIFTAYEQNKRMEFDFKIPALSADPEAAEKEWFLRTHPDTATMMEEPLPVPKTGLFGMLHKKEKRIHSVRCMACGAVNKKGQKFCGACGTLLQGVEEHPDRAVEEEKQEEVSSDITEEPKEAFVSPVWTKPSSASALLMGEKTQKSAQKEKPAYRSRGKNRGRKGMAFFMLVMAVLISSVVMFGASWMFLNRGGEEVIGDSQGNVSSTATEDSQGSEAFVGIRIKRQIAADNQDTIREEDLEGTILTPEQYLTLTERGTYIDSLGQLVPQTLISWEDRAQVIGQYVTATLPEGSLLYDTSVTSQHIITDRTYVQAEAGGEDFSLEIERGVLPGSTQIQIVALISTDGQNPVQVLLSEMTLQDRSLESVFNAAGEDILKMLAGENKTDEEVSKSGEEREGSKGEAEETLSKEAFEGS